MKEFSKEIIEIDGQNYTLFLNRQGIIAWEKYNKDLEQNLEKMHKKYENIANNESIEIKEDTNPFEGIEELSEDIDYVLETYKRLYWIMLYTEHKFTPSQANELFEKAIKEYGQEQIILLGNQMLEDANKDLANKNLKNLAALKSKK